MAKKKARKSTPIKRKPRTAPLPGMVDARIPALENIAGDYADIRDQRMDLNSQESKLKAKTLGLMREHGKAVYKRDGIEIRIIEGEENIKVRLKKDRTDDAGASEG